MSGYMRILEYHLGSFHGQLVDHLGHCLLISRNGMRTKMIVSFGLIVIFLWMLAAIRESAAIDSPWLPVVISTICSSG